VLVAGPGPLRSHWPFIGVLDVAVGLLALLLMLLANGVLLRRLLHPLTRLAARMETTDVLRSGERVPVGSSGEIGTIERAFNTMLDRLEQERRQAAAYALRAQEAERQRLARGLHDEVGQSMTAVLLQLKRLTASAAPEQQAALTEAQDVVKRSLDDVRRLARELRPGLLDHLGLASALLELATGFEERTRVHVHHRLDRSVLPLEPSVELVLYRVAQESLTNVARHANATTVDLSLDRDNGDGNVVLRVIDNGRGFEPNYEEGGGLRGIRERALIVGGATTIKPGPDGGVEVRLEVPATAT
jgi:two-component system sensor histidine kinase UhpB